MRQAASAPRSLLRLFFLVGKPSRHSPGAMASYTPEQAAVLAGYADMVDITKLPGSIDATALKSENASLKAKHAALEAELAALKAATGGDKPEPILHLAAKPISFCPSVFVG